MQNASGSPFYFFNLKSQWTFHMQCIYSVSILRYVLFMYIYNFFLFIIKKRERKISSIWHQHQEKRPRILTRAHVPSRHVTREKYDVKFVINVK